MRHGNPRRDRSRAPSSPHDAFLDALNDSAPTSGHRSKPDHKTQQLCRQVHRTIHLALGGELNDDRLAELTVAGVAAPGGAGHLIVEVHVPPDRSVGEMMARLDRATPRLRALIARAITRKRAPALTFVPAARGEVTP